MKLFVARAITPITFLFLFFIPFLWLPPGFVDLGGDGGRLFFLNPAVSKNYLYGISGSDINLYSNSFSYIPYVFGLSGVLRILKDPTLVISCVNGFILSMAFLSSYLFIRTLLLAHEKKIHPMINWSSYVGAVFYVTLVTAYNWRNALPELHTTWIYPFIAYLILSFFIYGKKIFLYSALLVSLLFSVNFGYTNAPHFFAFFPLVSVFLCLTATVIFKKRIQWTIVGVSVLLFIGLHAFHCLPSLAVFLGHSEKGSEVIFSSQFIQDRGVKYFDENYLQLGKISSSLFEPSQFYAQTICIVVVPLIVVLGFIKKRSKILALSGIFFMATLFLVSANITDVGVQLYRLLFFIPGFAMFRSFHDKWYVTFAFFYALVFAISWHSVTKDKKSWSVVIFGILFLAVSAYRIFPFLQGKAIREAIGYQSKNVSSVFQMDLDLLETLNFIKQLPDDGKVLTLPLTFPYYQVAYGKKGGAYSGISMIPTIAGRPDFAGFWSFGSYEQPIFDAVRQNNPQKVIELLSFLNIRYIFHNADRRIMDDFPGYPYVYPGMTYSSKEQIPSFKDQESYLSFLGSLPLKKLYERGFYSIYEIDDAYVRPFVYVPDIVEASQKEAVLRSKRSAFIDKNSCSMLVCGDRSDAIPIVTYKKESPVLYDITIDLKNRNTPFLLILSDMYYPGWNLSFDGIATQPIKGHIMANAYANAWIVDPLTLKGTAMLHGRIYLTFQNYFYFGSIVSGVTLVIVVYLTGRELF